jgi:DNA primase
LLAKNYQPTTNNAFSIVGPKSDLPLAFVKFHFYNCDHNNRTREEESQRQSEGQGKSVKAMRIPRGFADEVRQQVDIVRIISDYVTLKKRGANYLALCPFHQEKTPSFNVHPGKQIFKCFGCGVGGSVFEFIMRMEGCEFPEAVRIVAEKSGIPIPRVEERPESREAEKKEQQWRHDLLQINRWAQEFFAQQLNSSEGRRALEYLHARGVRPETVRQLGIGYAPQSWDALSNHLRRRKVPDAQIERSGLVTLRPDGQGNYDRFRGRLMFPIMDSQGRVVAFGGRRLDEQKAESGEQRTEPKYLNSPETAIYTKGNHLFGLSYAKESIRRAGFAILVEGYMDFAIPYQEEVHNLVASLGTALTEHQVSLLKRFTDKVVVNFDPDPAGRSAAQRSLQMLISHGFEVKVLILPAGEDPDSFVRRFGAAAYHERIAQAHGYLDFALAQSTESVDLNQPTGRARALKEIIPFLTIIPDRIERVTSGDYVASRLMIDPHLVQDEVRRQRQAQRDPKPLATTAANGKPLDLQSEMTQAEKRLWEILLNRGDVLERVMSQMEMDDFNGAVTQLLLAIIVQITREGGTVDYATLAQRLHEDARLRDLIERVLMSDVKGDTDALCAEATGCLAGLRRRRYLHQLNALQAEIERAKQGHDLERVNQLLRQKADIAKFLAKNLPHTNAGG